MYTTSTPLSKTPTKRVLHKKSLKHLCIKDHNQPQLVLEVGRFITKIFKPRSTQTYVEQLENYNCSQQSKNILLKIVQ